MQTQINFKLRWVGGIATGDFARYAEGEEPILPHVGQAIQINQADARGTFFVLRVDGPFIVRGSRRFTVEIRKWQPRYDLPYQSIERRAPKAS